MRQLKPQLLRAAERLSVRRRLREQDVQRRRRVQKHPGAPIADPHHQHRFAVMYCYHWSGGKDELGPRPRKADEGKASQDRRERKPAYDLG